MTITDAQARNGSAAIALRVLDPTKPSGVAAVSPTTASPGSSVLVTVAASAAINPVSTGLTITVNLSSIGGAAAQPLYDDGTHGDLTAGDGIYSFEQVVGAGTALGEKSLVATIADAQGRSATAMATLSVGGQVLFANGFE